MKKKITLSYVLSQFTLLFLAVLVIYPLFFVLMTSVKSNFDVLTNPFTIHSFKPQNYIEAWKLGKIGKYFMNSVFITALRYLYRWWLLFWLRIPLVSCSPGVTIYC